MTIYQCTLGCGLGRPGEVAAAPFLERKKIHGGGGGGIAFILQPGGQILSLSPVASAKNTPIKHRTRTSGFGMKRQGGGVTALFDMQKKAKI